MKAPLLLKRKDYQDRVKSLRPIAYWPLNERSGSVAVDISGYNRNGVYSGSGITLGSSGIGDNRAAATFPGADTCVGVGSVSFGNAWNGDKGTMIAWAKIDQASRWSDGLVGWWFHIRASDDVNYNCVMGKISSNTIQWRRRSGSSNPVTSISKTVGSPTNWMFMAMTWDIAASEIRAYDQSGFVGSASSGFTSWPKGTHVPDSPNISVLFAGSLTLQEWFGQGAHCAAFDYVLTGSQIASLASV